VVPDELHACVTFDRAHQLIRETREDRERLLQANAREFPVASGGVFSA